MRFSVDRTWRRPGTGEVVIGGSPTRAFRLTPAGCDVAAMIERGDDVPDSAGGLIDRLLDAGAVHPLADPSVRSLDASAITAVVPVHLTDTAHGPRLVELVAGLAGLAAVIVVDDASPLPLPNLVVDSTHVDVVRRLTNGGPAAARNSGLERVTTSHVVFIDSDVECRTDDVVALAGWLEASGAGVIAPRVRTIDDGTVLGAYEAVRSPLDMGDRPARVRAGTRVGYVPAAVLLCDTEAVRACGGFEEAMRTGEDVDLVWRLDAAGVRCRYEPSVEVVHRRRPDLASLLAQRSGYGESTVALHRRHGRHVAPARGSATTVGTWVTLAIGMPVIAAISAAVTAVLLVRKLRFVPNAAFESTRLALLTHLQVGRNLASAVTRTWWPIAVVAAIFSRRVRVAICAAAVLPALAEWWEKRPRLDPVRYSLLRIVDDAAYGTGVWKSVVHERDANALVPVVSAPFTQNA